MPRSRSAKCSRPMQAPYPPCAAPGACSGERALPGAPRSSPADPAADTQPAGQECCASRPASATGNTTSWEPLGLHKRRGVPPKTGVSAARTDGVSHFNWGYLLFWDGCASAAATTLPSAYVKEPCVLPGKRNNSFPATGCPRPAPKRRRRQRRPDRPSIKSSKSIRCSSRLTAGSPADTQERFSSNAKAAVRDVPLHSLTHPRPRSAPPLTVSDGSAPPPRGGNLARHWVARITRHRGSAVLARVGGCMCGLRAEVQPFLAAARPGEDEGEVVRGIWAAPRRIRAPPPQMAPALCAGRLVGGHGP